MKKNKVLSALLVVAIAFCIYQTYNYYSLKKELEAMKKEKEKEKQREVFPPYNTSITYITTGNF